MAATETIDMESFLALLAEEGDVTASGVAGDPLMEEAPDCPADEKGAWSGRFAPPRRPAGGGHAAAHTDHPLHQPRVSAASPASGHSQPSYMRGTVARAGVGHHHINAAGNSADTARSDASGHSGADSARSRSRSPATPASAAGRGGGAHKPSRAHSDGPTISGKPLFSALPGNASRAELLAAVESNITQAGAVGSGPVSMSDVIGLEDAKRALEEAIQFPRIMAALGTPLALAKGALLFGPPGTGKTQLARAQATAAGCTFFCVSASSIVSKWLGESEKMVRGLFDAARYYAPSIVFVDEIDALAGERGGGGEGDAMLRVKNELLTQMDGMASGSPDPERMVLVLGATNRPWALDEAFRRRLEKRILIPLPAAAARRELLAHATAHAQLEAGVRWDELVTRTEGYNCADVVILARDAMVGPLRELSARMKAEGVPVAQMLQWVRERGAAPPRVGQRHFEDALRRIRPSVGADSQRRTAEWAAEFGST